MLSQKECQARADYCRRLSETARSPTARQTWLMAEDAWRKRAAEVDPLIPPDREDAA